VIALLILHAVIGTAVFASGRRLGRHAFAVAAIPHVAAIVWLTAAMPGIVDGRARTAHLSWVPALNIGVELRLDGLGAAMVALVSGIGLLVCLYAVSYFRPHDEHDESDGSVARHPEQTELGLGRLAGLMTMFAGSMLGVVLADDLIVLFTAWELTSISSYLLIGNEHTRFQARAAALHALLVTSAGGLVMMAGFVLIGQAAGSYRISDLVANPPTGTGVTVGAMLVLVGAFTKSAQYPFHSWLPGAMVAPTPVSAYLHSATMVKAGVYLVARLAPGFMSVPGWRPVVVGVGLFTMIVAGLRALRQYDLKLLLAHGTVSQLGLMMVLFGVGLPRAATAGCVLLLAHGLFKATLFMVTGTIDHQTGTRDIRRIPPLGARWRWTVAAGVVAAASMAGVPLAFGFIAKEAAYESMLHGGFLASSVVAACVVAGSMLTAAYSARIIWALAWTPRARIDPTSAHPFASPPSWAFAAPAGVLSVLTLVLGVAPAIADPLVTAAGQALHPSMSAADLAIWHGANRALALSALTLLVGGLLFVARGPVSKVLASGAGVPSGTAAYSGLLRGLNRVAGELTGRIQSGSLPFYSGVILGTAAVVPGVVLLTSTSWPGWPEATTSPAEIPVVAVLIGAAFGAAVVRRRFSAALFLGVVGYSMAGLFVVHGAPDLALTQAAIETLSTVVFVLVLRRLPDRFERRSTSGFRVLRAGISMTVAVAVFAFAITARGARTAQPVSTQIVEQSVPEGHGRNVVNVILVDVRGLDTLAEITVLAAAAVGAVALARVGRGTGRRPAAATHTEGPL
jgi:multicomponent Na+:H+ antiporter subunit A